MAHTIIMYGENRRLHPASGMTVNLYYSVSAVMQSVLQMK